MGNGASTKVIIPSLTVIGLLVFVTMAGILTLLIRVFRKAKRKQHDVGAESSQNGLLYSKDSRGMRSEKRTSFAVETHIDSSYDTLGAVDFDNRPLNMGTVTIITAQKMDDNRRDYQPSPILSTSVNTEDVVQMTEVGPGSLRKIELLTGSKVIPPPKPLPPPRRRGSLDSRYSKRRYSHPAPSRLSTVASSDGRYSPHLESSPATTQMSYDYTRIHSLRAPPALRRDILSWAGHPINETLTPSFSSASDLDLPRTLNLNLALPQHIVSQMKNIDSDFENVSNEPTQRRSAERSTVRKPPVAARRYAQNQLLAPHLQTHRRSWSGRSVLELDHSPADEKKTPGVVGSYASDTDEDSPFYTGPARTRQAPIHTSRHIALAASPNISNGRLGPPLYTPIPRSVPSASAEPDTSANFLASDRGSTVSGRDSMSSDHSALQDHANVTVLSPPPAQRQNGKQFMEATSNVDKRKSIMSEDGKSVAETMFSEGSNITEKELEWEMRRARRNYSNRKPVRTFGEQDDGYY